MKILLVVSELPPARSGVALSANRLIESYRRRGHEVETLVMRELPKLVWRESRLSFFFLRWPSIRRAISRCDCVHVHGPSPTFSDLFLLLLRASVPRGSRPKVVYTHHFELDLAGLGMPCRLYNGAHGRLLRLADSVVVTSNAYARLLAGRGSRDVHVIPWGADHRAYPPEPRSEEGFDVLAVGQLRPYKGLDVLLRAFRRLPNDVRLHVVGDGHRRSRYEALARRLGLSQARFHGALPDSELSALFSSCHAVVLPSVSKMEAFGIALLEGMMTGAVPVASRLPGVEEVVEDAGILVPPGDPEALAEALLRLHRDGALWERLSRRAARRAASFRWKDTGARYVELIERLSKDERLSRLGQPTHAA